MVMRRSTLRQLLAEARHEAALITPNASEYDFYAGTAEAVEDHLSPESLAHHDESWMQRQSPMFRDGYVRGEALIASSAPDELHLMLPVPEHSA